MDALGQEPVTYIERTEFLGGERSTTTPLNYVPTATPDRALDTINAYQQVDRLLAVDANLKILVPSAEEPTPALAGQWSHLGQ